MSNCLIHALRCWWQRGGYIIVRKSDYGWWPHFIWSGNLITFEEFEPDQPARARLFPPPLFRGHVHRFFYHEV